MTQVKRTAFKVTPFPVNTAFNKPQSKGLADDVPTIA
jgi:hypothetical protein